MSNAGLDKLAWALIYGGLFVLGLGLFLRRGDASTGMALVIVGAVVAAVGAVLIWVRSRRADD